MKRFLALGAALGLALASVGGVAAAGSHAPREVMMPPRGAAGHAKPVRSSNLSFHGGNPGVVKGTDKAYLVLWGSQWNGNDSSREATTLQDFFNNVGGSSWNNSVTQYCDGIAPGSSTCGAGNHATNPTGVLAGIWSDNGSLAPAHPSQSQLAAEAVNAAAHYGNTTAAKNAVVQYVIMTASGSSASGAGSSYCAWHSSVGAYGGSIAYTNLPYITDFGASCGAGFNGLSATAGITIVEGHEFAETETDIFPNGGWLDSQGAENGDKCAWISGTGPGASQNVTFAPGVTLAVQSLWSNAANGGRGGCVVSYP